MPTEIIQIIIPHNFFSRSAYCRNPLCYIRHPLLLSNTIKADAVILAECHRKRGPTRELFHCSPREESRHTQADESTASSTLVKKNFGLQKCNALPFRKHWNYFWNTKRSITLTLTRHKVENWNTHSYGVISFHERQITCLPLSLKKYQPFT